MVSSEVWNVVFRPNEAFLHRYLQLSNTETSVETSRVSQSQLSSVRDSSHVTNRCGYHTDLVCPPTDQPGHDGSGQHPQQTSLSHNRTI